MKELIGKLVDLDVRFRLFIWFEGERVSYEGGGWWGSI